ncbi:uncharacterized protein O3C94_002475 [Discoglossus pictus]
MTWSPVLLMAVICRGFVLGSTAYLPAPTMTVSLSRAVYYKGEVITVTCSPPGGAIVSGIILYKNGVEYQREVLIKCFKHSISTFDMESAGTYYCGYFQEKDGLLYTSYRSNTVKIKIKDFPSAPTIILSPSRSVYDRGETITMTCSPPHGAIVKGSILYKDGKEAQKVVLISNVKHVTFTSVMESAGEYYCVYLEEDNGMYYMSYHSNTVNVNIKEATFNEPFSPGVNTTVLQESRRLFRAGCIYLLLKAGCGVSLMLYQLHSVIVSRKRKDTARGNTRMISSALSE